METNFVLFLEEKKIGGWLLAIRNNWNEDLRRTFVSDDVKQAYTETFGQKVLKEDDFLDWYCEYKKQKNEQLSKN